VPHAADSTDDDEELPERIESGRTSATTTPVSSPPATPDPVLRDSPKSEPIVAGFDLSAMPKRLPMPPSMPPSSRSESAPLPLQEGDSESRSTTPTPRRPAHGVRGESEAGPSSQRDLAGLYARSMSLASSSEVYDTDHDDVEGRSPTEADLTSWNAAAPLDGIRRPACGLDDFATPSSSSSFGYRSRPAAESTLSFGGQDGSIWTMDEAPPPSSALASGLGGNPFGRGFKPALPSENILSFKGSSAPQSSSSVATHDLSFPSSSSSVSLAFGGQDGSVTSAGAGGNTDYWSPPALAGSRKGSSKFDLNPWS